MGTFDTILLVLRYKTKLKLERSKDLILIFIVNINWVKSEFFSYYCRLTSQYARCHKGEIGQDMSMESNPGVEQCMAKALRGLKES